MNKLITVICLLGIALGSSFAMAQAHKGISFQGVIKSPGGAFPTVSGVVVNARILSPNDCILREEQFGSVNISNGYINLVIGKGSTLGYNPGFTMTQVMDNAPTVTPITGLTCLNSDGSVNSGVTSYTPAASDARKLRVSLTISGDPIIADFNMRAVAYAVHTEMSDNSKALNGLTDSGFVKTSANIVQAAVESFFTSLGLGTIAANISGNAATATTATTAGNVSGTVAIANGGTGATTAPLARTSLGLGSLATVTPTGTADTTTFLRGDGSWQTLPTPVLTASDITDFSTAADSRITTVVGTWKGAVNGLASLDAGGKVPSAQLPAASGDGSALTNLQVDIDKITNAATKYFDYRPNGAACGNDQMLKYTTGTGWVCTAAPAGVVTSVAAAATAGNPIAIAGTGAVPTVDIPVATSLVNGYLSSADWTTFNSKMASNSELSALGGLATTGILQRTGANTYVALGTTAPINVTAGNIGISIGAGLTTNTGSIVPDFATTTTAGKVVQANDARLPAATCTAGNIMRWDGSAWQCEATSLADGSVTAAKLASSVGVWSVVTTDVYRAGSVGIGTGGAPRAALDVSGGSIIGKASLVNGSTTVDFSLGNIQHTTADWTSFQLDNLKDGGTYMFIVKGTNPTTCSFSAYSGAGSGLLTVHLPPDHGPATNGKHTIYNIAVSGGDVYLAWTPGY